VAKQSIYGFTVVAQHPVSFPMDMLRYDSAWPVRSEDCFAIEHVVARSLMEGTDKHVEIRLNSLRRPTEGRWESFGWRVKEIEQ
jgi:hypothetical protein